MTRVTSIGIKRTYLQAGFAGDDSQPAAAPEVAQTVANDCEEAAPAQDRSAKKKRKRVKKGKTMRDSNVSESKDGEKQSRPTKPGPSGRNRAKEIFGRKGSCFYDYISALLFTLPPPPKTRLLG